MTVEGTSIRYVEASLDDGSFAGRLRYLQGGAGPPLLLLHTVRTQAEHFHRLIPLLLPRYTVYALDLPGMGWSDIVPGAQYGEEQMRAGVGRFLAHLDLDDVTVVGESLGAVLALTAAATWPDRIRRVVAVNPYDYKGGILRSSVLARVIFSAVLAPVIGPAFAAVEPRPIMKSILKGGLVDTSALTTEYLDELLAVGKRIGYPAVARAVYGIVPSLMSARSHYSQVSVPIDLVYGERDWSRNSDRESNRKLLNHATFRRIPDVSHFVALERPGVISAIVD